VEPGLTNSIGQQRMNSPRRNTHSLQHSFHSRWHRIETSRRVPSLSKVANRASTSNLELCCVDSNRYDFKKLKKPPDRLPSSNGTDPFHHLRIPSQLVAITAITGILHASRESRDQAAKFTKPVFQAILENKPFYFNFDLDELSFNGCGAMASFYGQGELSDVAEKEVEILNASLKRLVLGRQILGTPATKLMARMKSVETVILEDQKQFLSNRASEGVNSRVSDHLDKVWKVVKGSKAVRTHIQFLTREGIDEMATPEVRRHREKQVADIGVGTGCKGE